MTNRKLFPLVVAGLVAISISASATLIFTVTDTRPGELGVTTPTSTLGSVASTASVPTTTYTITGLDLTSAGGGASETIVFDIDYTQTGGTAVQINGFGNISVTGGASDNQIDVSPSDNEDLTATLSLNSTTFAGDFNLSIIEVTIGGFNPWESYNLTTDDGTTTGITTTVQTIDSSFFTIDPIDDDGFTNTDQMNLSGFTVQITVATIPEPSTVALFGLGGLALVWFRRRSQSRT